MKTKKGTFLSRMNFGTKIIIVVALSFVISNLISFLFIKQRIEEMAMNNLVEKAETLTLQAENARKYMGEMRGKYNVFHESRIMQETLETVKGIKDSEDRLNALRQTPFYKTIPVVISWEIAEDESGKLGHEFKVVKRQARSKDREARGIEIKMLENMERTGEESHYVIDEEIDSLRYMRAVRLSENCMLCHGTRADDPDGDGYDPIGFKMEGWKVGETRGGMEIISDLGPMHREVNITLLLIGAIGAGIIIVVVLVVSFLIRSLAIKPVKSIGEAVRALAKGDLTANVAEAKTQDDIGETLISVKKTFEQLRMIVSQTVGSAKQVAQAADQIAEANNDFSSMISRQAASVEETSATMEEMASSINNTAKNANKVNDIMAQTKQSAQEGVPVMDNTIEAMDEINHSSEKVSNIIDVIEDISFQTNLLALNAAVEAARAGEHGRGFAVVASEIHGLAQRSSGSAKEISALITESRKKTKRGVELANKLNEKLKEIEESVTKAADLMNEVDSAASEQKTGAEQVNAAVVEIDEATQKNSALVEENAASAEELASQSQELVRLVSFFKVEETELKETPRIDSAAKGKKKTAPKKKPNGNSGNSDRAKQLKPPKENQKNFDDEGFEEF